MTKYATKNHPSLVEKNKNETTTRNKYANER